MSSDASYTRCDMGLFDFFRRSSSRSRSKTTTNTTTTTTVTTQTTINQSSTHDNNSTAVMTETVSVSVKEPVYPQRASMPDAHKFQSMASASTVSTESNNDSSEFGDDDEPQRQSESLGSINNYEIVRELGRGATAVVQLGKQKNGDRLVALKVFKTSLLKKMREVKRVGRRMVVSTALDKVQIEIAIMKKFQHKNLLNLLEVFDDDSETLVLMLEYAPHGQIMEWNATERVYRANPKVVGDRGVFDEDSLRGCVRQLLLGLEYLHENSICHRDLKPENILLGEDGVYKIADFGVAHLFEEEKKETDAVATPATSEASSPAKKKGIVASTAGTYAFMAPETLKGKEYSAYDADIWALGITIHALALGKIPYYHIDVVELFEMIENQPLDLGDADNNNNSLLSEGLTSLLRGMLEKDPESRWSIKQCKQSPWLLEGLDDAAKEAFLNPSHEQVQVNPEDVAKAVTKVTSMNVLLRVQLGANKWKRKAMASLEMKKRASLSAAPTIDEEASDRMSVASSYSDRPSFVLTKTPSGEELQGNQQEA